MARSKNIFDTGLALLLKFVLSVLSGVGLGIAAMTLGTPSIMFPALGLSGAAFALAINDQRGIRGRESLVVLFGAALGYILLLSSIL